MYTDVEKIKQYVDPATNRFVSSCTILLRSFLNGSIFNNLFFLDGILLRFKSEMFLILNY